MKQVVSAHLLDGARPLAYTVDGASTASGACRSTLYVDMKSGKLPARKLGKRTLILAKDLERYLEGLPTLAEAKAQPASTTSKNAAQLEAARSMRRRRPTRKAAASAAAE